MNPDSVRARVMLALAHRRTSALGPVVPVSVDVLADELTLPARFVTHALRELQGVGFVDLSYHLGQWLATATPAGVVACQTPLTTEE